MHTRRRQRQEDHDFAASLGYIFLYRSHWVGASPQETVAEVAEMVTLHFLHFLQAERSISREQKFLEENDPESSMNL